jgi:hypothetical protein
VWHPHLPHCLANYGGVASARWPTRRLGVPLLPTGTDCHYCIKAYQKSHPTRHPPPPPALPPVPVPVHSIPLLFCAARLLHLMRRQFGSE